LADFERRHENAERAADLKTSTSRLIAQNSNSGSILMMLMRGGSTFIVRARDVLNQSSIY
jgi:hypothetical protein